MIDISKIFHIADIHIRNLKRHDEYRSVFKRLFKYLKQNVDSKSVIFLGGDIVHSKNDMSPELVDMVSSFLTGCADIAPTIVITGNHDANLNNDSRLDTLTPIISALNNDNIYYWKDTGVYNLRGVSFSVFSVFGNPENWITANDIESDYKIALHHGAVSSAVTDLNYNIENEFVTPKLFDGFDLVLLGDIHKRQYLDSKKTIAYPGSLIQQNHGEDIDHGILVWDLATKQSEYVRIENTIAYATIEILDGKVTSSREYIDALPKNLRLRVRYKNTEYKDIQKIIQLLKTRHTLLETTVIRVNDTESNLQDHHTVLGDVRDVEYQNTLITQYLEALDSKKTVNIDLVRHVNRVMNSKLDKTAVIVRNVVWKPLVFEFSNMFSYGENNSIDFSNYTGVQGLFAPNASGKSTLLDAVTFCLFDKCSRTYRAKDVMNNNRNKFQCKLTFELNNEIFVIERFGERHKRTGNVRVDVNFGKMVNGEYQSLNDIDRDSTNKIIRGYIGSYDDFLLTALSTQNDNKNFIFKTQRERKDLLNSFLDISIFDELYLVTRNEIKGKQVLIKNLESDVLQDHYTTLPSQINEIHEKFIETSGSYTHEETVLKTKESELNSLRIQIQNVDEIIDIDAVTKSIDENITTRERLKQTISEYTDEIKTCKSDLVKLQDSFSKLDLEKIESDKTRLQEITNSLQKRKEQYARVSANLKHYQEQISHLDSHEYDPNCKYCVNNPFVQKASEAKDKLPETIEKHESLKSEIQSLTREHDELKPLVQQSESSYNQLRNDIGSLESKIVNYENLNSNNRELSKTIDDKIKHLKQQEKKYHKQESIQLNNKLLLEKIAELEIEYNSNKTIQKKYHNDMMTYSNKLSSLQTTFDIWKTKQMQLNDLYDEISVYESYLESIAKNGVPYMLLKKILPVIEDEVNSILNQIVEFYVTLEADDKNINCYIHYNDEMNWPVELASGMERFMISVAMRAALINVSSLPRPNFIAIDEGFGVLDSDKISSVGLLFDFLKTQFDFILCISHLDAMKDLADSLIHINKNTKGFSEIKAA